MSYVVDAFTDCTVCEAPTRALARRKAARLNRLNAAREGVFRGGRYFVTGEPDSAVQ